MRVWLFRVVPAFFTLHNSKQPILSRATPNKRNSHLIMQLSLFIFGLLANIISAVPTPETPSTCLNVRKMQPQPQIYGWESALEYLVFQKGGYG
ncbi:hypothetical protein N7454_005574 [Penicillium verhagenii]|nr:hypothetical protein N7454_005574 [Penicillium verhagenii]